MGQGLGDKQKALFEIVGDEWMTTPEIARAYHISPSDRTLYRTMIYSLDGMNKPRGMIDKRQEIVNGRAVSFWRVNPNYVAPVAKLVTPAKPAPEKPAQVSKKPSKAPSKSARRPVDNIMRSKA